MRGEGEEHAEAAVVLGCRRLGWVPALAAGAAACSSWVYSASGAQSLGAVSLRQEAAGRNLAEPTSFGATLLGEVLASAELGLWPLTAAYVAGVEAGIVD